MGVELILSVWRDGDVASISKQAVEMIFADHIAVAGEAQWELRYGLDEPCTATLLPALTRSDLIGMVIDGPGKDVRFWDAVARVLRLGNVLLHGPGQPSLLIGSAAVRQHVPAEMFEAHGEPAVVQSGEDILQSVRAT